MLEVIGIGLDGKAGLSENVKQLIENATILVGSDRHLSYFPTHPAKKIVLGNFLEAIEVLKQNLLENIVILVTGDPLFFGLGRLLLEKIPSEQLRFHPHLTSVQLAFNRIKISWQDAKLISVHGRNIDELMPFLQQGVEKIAILTDDNNNPSAIARFYQKLDLPTHYDIWVCENLGDLNEKVTCFAATETDKLASLSNKDFAALNIVILLRQEKEQLVNLNNLPLFGLPDSVFLSFGDRPGLMTKREIRLIVLGELALTSQQIIWDIGAGTGSVSIEIARLCPTSKIYAVEKTAMGINLIEKNCQKFQVNNVIPVSGTAPDAVTKLPNPNRIFIGGSGGSLSSILAICQEKLQADGTLVLALATLENLNESLVCLSSCNWNYRLLQVQISRSVSIGKMTRFSPLNPVTIITATR